MYFAGKLVYLIVLPSNQLAINLQINKKHSISTNVLAQNLIKLNVKNKKI